MQRDLQLSGVARAIYDACYPGEEWSPLSFEEAERYGTIHYRQAVDAALQARCMLTDRAERLELL